MAEWPNAAVLKTVVPQGTVSSNLTLSVFYNTVGQRREIRDPLNSDAVQGFFYVRTCQRVAQ